ncbi:protein disulfide isomerase [Thozetella sp. PMI_491]|nr:protein disulfide isomerase [Thozetella sp. PMI_491]
MKTSPGWLAATVASLAASAVAWGSEDATAVVGAEELNPASFQQFVTSAEVAMVDFYAPWCGHCQRFAPKFDAAAKSISATSLDAKLGKVDCTVYSDFCREKAISLYPTMKIYKQGKELYHEYTGPRRVTAIVEFLKKQVLPIITHISSKQSLDDFLVKEKSEIVLIGYIDENDQFAKDQFSAAAEKLHEDFPIGLASSTEVARYKNIAKTPAIVLYEPWEEGNVVYDGEFEIEAIKKFAQTAYTPLVGELNGDTFNQYTSGAPTAFFFAKLDDGVKEWTDKLKPIAKTQKIRIAVANTNEFGGFAEFLAVGDNGYPSFAIYDPRIKQKFAAAETGTSLTTDKIARLVDDFVAGNLSPTIKSLPVPARQDGPVTVVVAKTFDQIVMDPTKDVLINFFREDCPYCKALAPTWDKLGELYKKQQLSDHLVVAAVDASKNELSDKPMFVPSIKLYKAGDKSNPVFYTGNRSIQDLIQFVKDHSTSGFDANAAAMPEEPIENHQPVIHGQSPMHYGHDEL